jgi:hypothetical protein
MEARGFVVPPGQGRVWEMAAGRWVDEPARGRQPGTPPWLHKARVFTRWRKDGTRAIFAGRAVGNLLSNARAVCGGNGEAG